jgi:hypothetical protein
MLRALAVSAMTLALVSCSHSPHRSGTPVSPSAGPRSDVLVTIGSAATFGSGLGLAVRLRDSWPQLLYHEAFPRSTVLVNASELQDVTVETASTDQLPLALEEHATVVAVWIGDADLARRLPIANFEADLDTLVRRLRDSGARVLLANLPGRQASASGYDDAIARVARSRSATLVDLAAALSSTPDVGPSSRVNPTTSRTIAQAFALAVARS